MPVADTANSRSICKRGLFQPMQQSTTASAEYGNSGLELWRRAADDAEVVTVSVVEAAPPDGVTEPGKKLHDAPDGNPEQAKFTTELKPYSGVTVIEVVPLCPPVTEMEEGEAAME